MPAAEADIATGHAASYLTRLCGHAAKMSQASHRPRHRRAAHGRGDGPPEVRHVERAGTEATVTLNWGQWSMRALPGRLAVRAEAADEQDLRRIQDLLTTRLETFGRREHLTVTWQTAAGGERTAADQEDHQGERVRSPAPLPADRIEPDHRDAGSGSRVTGRRGG
jgi:hypothetical protein